METRTMADTKAAQSAPDEKDDEGAAPAKASGKVLLRSKMLDEFLVPAERDKAGKPKGDDLLITHDGVEVTAKQAEDLIALAEAHNVTLTAKEI
jgi:hypothetical protein